MPKERITATKPMKPPLTSPIKVLLSSVSETRNFMSQGIDCSAKSVCAWCETAALQIGTSGFMKKFRENEPQASVNHGCTILTFSRSLKGFRHSFADAPGAALNHEKKNVSETGGSGWSRSDFVACGEAGSKEQSAGETEELGGKHRIQHGESERGEVGGGSEGIRQEDGKAEGARDKALLQHNRRQQEWLLVANRHSQRAHAERGGKTRDCRCEHYVWPVGALAARERIRAAQSGFTAAHFSGGSGEHGDARIWREEREFGDGSTRVRFGDG